MGRSPRAPAPRMVLDRLIADARIEDLAISYHQSKLAGQVTNATGEQTPQLTGEEPTGLELRTPYPLLCFMMRFSSVCIICSFLSAAIAGSRPVSGNQI